MELESNNKRCKLSWRQGHAQNDPWVSPSLSSAPLSTVGTARPLLVILSTAAAGGKPGGKKYTFGGLQSSGAGSRRDERNLGCSMSPVYVHCPGVPSFPPEVPAWVFRPLIPEKPSSSLPLAPRPPRPRDLGVESIYWTQRSGSSMENSDSTQSPTSL